MSNRIAIKFGGESGQGINTLGKLLSKAIKDSGFCTFAYREYPSLIRGGYASYQVDASEYQISSSLRECNVLAVLDDDAMHQYLPTVNEKGIVLYDDKEIVLTEEEKKLVKEKNLSVIYLDTIQIAKDNGGVEIMANVVMLGFIWRILGIDLKGLSKVVKGHFSKKKNIDIEAEIRCLKGGYNAKEYENVKQIQTVKRQIKGWDKSMMLSGNDGISLGAIVAGCRAYYAYPMTPATSILSFLGNTYKDTGILIKQAENEITAAQMALGSMYMGARAMTATSGGGFDLMVETISCAGMSETPLVIILAQRNGPGTGVPTWTGAGDLYAAVRSGHGEFPRCVLSVSDAQDSYELTQKAFDIAEKYQIPVIVLTEKQIAESLFNVRKLSKPMKISRYSVKGKERYGISKTGISTRWIPKKTSKPYLSTSDEHLPDGTSTEDSERIIEMMEKRLRKTETLTKELPEPEYYGSKNPDIVFVGFGSVKNTLLDVIKMGVKNIGYLHYQYIYPLKTEKILNLYESGTRLVSIENNQTGQLSRLIKEESGLDIPEKLLKFDGRPFFVEDILDFFNE